MWHERLMRYVPLFIWISVIFALSSGQASMSETSRFIRPVLEFLFPMASDETMLWVLKAIRKLAHVFIYATLALFAARAFYGSSIFLRRYWFAASTLLILIIASIDETHQSFTSSRTGTVWDVLIDLCSGIAMIIIILIFKNKRPLSRVFSQK